MNTIYQIATSAKVSMEELNELNRIQDEYCISISLYTIHICKMIADKMKGGLSMINGCSGTHFIMREILNIYTPFEKARPYTPCSFSINVKSEISYTEIQNNLKEVGILNTSKLIRAILRTVIKYPEEVSTCRISGILNRKYASPYRMNKYKNEPLNMTIRLSSFLKNEIESISDKAKMTVNDIIVSVIKTLCDIEFDNGYTLSHNADIMRECILQSSSKNVYKRGYEFISVTVPDIKYSIQTLILMEKYGIPGKQEFISRIVQFIVDSAQGAIRIVKESIDDDEDYNETRLVRNAYRKEVTYAAACH